MRALSDKIIELQAKLQGLTGQDVQNRGPAFLKKLAENYGNLIKGKVYIDLPMTHQEFASASGFIILDYEALKKWSHK